MDGWNGWMEWLDGIDGWMEWMDGEKTKIYVTQEH
jgi:hypothetical protein